MKEEENYHPLVRFYLPSNLLLLFLFLVSLSRCPAARAIIKERRAKSEAERTRGCSSSIGEMAVVVVEMVVESVHRVHNNIYKRKCSVQCSHSGVEARTGDNSRSPKGCPFKRSKPTE